MSSSDDIGKVARYVAKYVVKDGDFKVPNSSVEPPRLMTSVGFGCPDSRFVDWLLCRDKFDYDPFDKSSITHQIVLAVSERMYFPYKGFRYSIPLYILRKVLYEKILKVILNRLPYSKWSEQLYESELKLTIIKNLKNLSTPTLKEKLEKLWLSIPLVKRIIFLKNSILKERIIYQSTKML